MSAGVSGAEGRVCARRDRFGASWTAWLEDSEDDGRPATATIGLEVADARDPDATLRNELGGGTATSSHGSFHPRAGSALGDLSITTCVDVPFRPDRCQTASVELPQLIGRASEAQAARLESLVFEQSLEDFVATRDQERHVGVDADFDWSSDGCSAGPLVMLLKDLEGACQRHDFAYRNFGQLFYDPTDSMRRRVDEQLAADADALGRADLAPALLDGLQRFAAPVFYGEQLASIWGVPRSLADWLRTEPARGSAPDAR